MYRNFKKTVLGVAVSALIMTTPAYAMIKSVHIDADLDNIPSKAAGEAFFPEFIPGDDDEDDISIDKQQINDQMTLNPTIPVVYKVKIKSDDGRLDEDLKVMSKGVRSTSVDYVSEDGEEAEVRLMVYPFYQLKKPEDIKIADNGIVSWKEVDFADKYEIIVSWNKKNGDEADKHFYKDDPRFDASSYIKKSKDGKIGIAIRALPISEEGYMYVNEAYNEGIDSGLKEHGYVRTPNISWKRMDFADKYKICLEYIGSDGNKKKKYIVEDDTKRDIGAYINSAKDKRVKVTVRPLPRRDDREYFNLAMSEFAYAGTIAVDTSDYEPEDYWDFLGDYEAVQDANMADYCRRKGQSSNTSFGFRSANWKRTGSKWQYIRDGKAYNSGWLKINTYWYYFGNDGYLKTGWINDAGKWYYLDPSIGDDYGKMRTGNCKINGKDFIFAADGVCVNF